jgi:hypothetical protein
MKQTRKIDKEIEVMENNQVQNTDLKNKITEVSPSLERFRY